MRRALVLTDETARHPFLASLPPHVRSGEVPKSARPRWRLTGADVRGFFTAYLASLAVIAVFIA
ncbi:MAG: hypothetical protein KJZ64_09780 [Sphingomonadaceae bacterium]|nr:hypothetical protein [Sphingomonadaceae bacterium]